MSPKTYEASEAISMHNPEFRLQEPSTQYEPDLKCVNLPSSLSLAPHGVFYLYLINHVVQAS